MGRIAKVFASCANHHATRVAAHKEAAQHGGEDGHRARAPTKASTSHVADLGSFGLLFTCSLHDQVSKSSLKQEHEITIKIFLRGRNIPHIIHVSHTATGGVAVVTPLKDINSVRVRNVRVSWPPNDAYHNTTRCIARATYRIQHFKTG